ncbi:YceI family protein [Actinosynnema sp. NPDC059797]
MTGLIPPGKWVVDPARSKLGFTVRHLTFRVVNGLVPVRAGEIVLAEDGRTAHASAELDLAGVDTGNPLRDDFIRSERFFDVERFPTVTYRSLTATPVGPHWFTTGELRIAETAAPIGLRVTWGATARDRHGDLRGRLIAVGELRRRDLGIVIGGRVGDSAAVLGTKVRLRLDVQVVRPAEVFRAEGP